MRAVFDRHDFDFMVIAKMCFLKGLVPRLVPRDGNEENNSLHCKELLLELIGIEEPNHFSLLR